MANLAAEFGIDEKKVFSYLDHADRYQYTLVKGPMAKKQELLAEIFKVNQGIKDCATPEAELGRLRQREEALTAELTRLSVDVLGDPEAL